MSKDILNKIVYLCQLIPEVEWSGILLYTVQGSIKKPNEMRVILKEIIPMNKHSKGYTEYRFNEVSRDLSSIDDKMIDYFNERPEALEENWQVGLIHSHNTMPVFFSDTDMSELNDNAGSHNYYLSFIVNNKLDFLAKIASVAETENVVKGEYFANSENGEKYLVGTKEIKVSDKILMIWDCEIEYPKHELRIEDSIFVNNVDDIINKASKAITNKIYNSKDIWNNNKKLYNPIVEDKIVSKSKPKVWQAAPSIADLEYFIIELLMGTEEGINDLTIEDVCEQIELFHIEEVEGYNITEEIMHGYLDTYEKTFGRVSSKDHFIDTIQGIIEILEEYAKFYDFVEELIDRLKYLNKQYQNGRIKIQ